MTSINPAAGAAAASLRLDVAGFRACLRHRLEDREMDKHPLVCVGDSLAGPLQALSEANATRARYRIRLCATKPRGTLKRKDCAADVAAGSRAGSCRAGKVS